MSHVAGPARVTTHGFDVEGQCLLPLLCNARHKVILVRDPAWPHHPSGRAHFRMLWLAGATPPQPVRPRAPTCDEWPNPRSTRELSRISERVTSDPGWSCHATA